MNIILGGTSGLGKEITECLQEFEQDTFVVGRSYDPELHGEGMAVDFTKDEEVDQLVSYIESLDEAALRGLFWVSGYGYNGDFADQTEVRRMALTNYANVIPIVQAAWKKFVAAEVQTNLVIISSTTGQKPRSNEAVYSSTKAAQVMLARSLGKEAERLEAKVRVALFMPGGMQTRFWEGNLPDSFDDFLDPAKVAQKVCDAVGGQEDYFYEETIERGSL